MVNAAALIDERFSSARSEACSSDTVSVVIGVRLHVAEHCIVLQLVVLQQLSTGAHNARLMRSVKMNSNVQPFVVEISHHIMCITQGMKLLEFC